MVLKAEPILKAFSDHPVQGKGIRIYLTPWGEKVTQNILKELTRYEEVQILCGRYEGVDERVVDLAIDRCFSVGDFVFAGGEAGALMVMEGIIRLLSGGVGNEKSVEEESFSIPYLLEGPQYTRPREVGGLKVPEILLSGDHKKIRAFRYYSSLQRTLTYRPDLIRDEVLLRMRKLSLVLLHFPVKNPRGEMTCTATTPLDIHDLARSAYTYGTGYFVVQPLVSQRTVIERILHHWTEGGGGKLHPYRAPPLRRVKVFSSLTEIVPFLKDPYFLFTSATPPKVTLTIPQLAEKLFQEERDFLLLLGTGWGLREEVAIGADGILEPITIGDYNHLSVRSAGAIYLDRIFHALLFYLLGRGEE
jgi:tRNA (guanine37-N1)-methyltransferase